MRAGLVVLALLAVAVPTTVATGKQGGGGGGGTQCSNVNEPVTKLSSTAVRKAVLCRLNEERRQHGRDPLKVNKILKSLAQRHTSKMVQTNCLSHECPGEASLDSRISNSPYTKGASDFSYGENTGCGVSVKAMVANWLASSFHRANILNKKFRDAGIGFSPENVPSRCSGDYGTFTAVFGFRKN